MTNRYEVRHTAKYELYAASPDKAFEEAINPTTPPSEEEWLVTLKEDDD